MVGQREKPMLKRLPWQALVCLSTGIALGLWMARSEVAVTAESLAEEEIGRAHV